MTKKEFIDLFEKYDDDADIQFFNQDDDTWIEPKTIEQDVEDDSLIVNFTK